MITSLNKTRFNDITLEKLLRMGGITGAILSEGGRRILSQTTLPDPQAAHLAQLARNLCRGYRKVGRIPTKILVAYQKLALLIVSRDDAQLVLILETKVDIDALGNAAVALLTKRMQRPIRLPAPRPAA